VPPLEILDMAMHGNELNDPDFDNPRQPGGSFLSPESEFGSLIASAMQSEALDPLNCDAKAFLERRYALNADDAFEDRPDWVIRCDAVFVANFDVFEAHDLAPDDLEGFAEFLFETRGIAGCSPEVAAWEKIRLVKHSSML
jgi:hypothetical protein